VRERVSRDGRSVSGLAVVVLLAHAVRARVARRRRAAARVRRCWRRAMALVYGKVGERLTSGATGRKGVACRSVVVGWTRNPACRKLEGGYHAKTQGPIGLSLESPEGKVEMQEHGLGMEFVTECIDWFQGDGFFN
jgi:hypothetical protein